MNKTKKGGSGAGILNGSYRHTTEGGGVHKTTAKTVLLSQRFSDCGTHQNHLEGSRRRGPQLALDSPIPLVGPRICISSKCLHEVDAVC